ncbi:hypothetical protein VB005_08841 [Metarhizium brunneum]
MLMGDTSTGAGDVDNPRTPDGPKFAFNSSQLTSARQQYQVTKQDISGSQKYSIHRIFCFLCRTLRQTPNCNTSCERR